MQDLQTCKFINVTPPAAIVDDAGFTTASVDTKGWNQLAFVVSLGATDIALAAFKLQTSDTDGSYADLTGADFSVSPLTLASATDDNKIYVIFVDLRGKKRYFDLTLTAGNGSTGTYASVLAILTGGNEVPSTATLRGLGQQALV